MPRRYATGVPTLPLELTNAYSLLSVAPPPVEKKKAFTTLVPYMRIAPGDASITASVAAVSAEADLGPQRQLLARVAGATSELARTIERLAKAQADAEKGDHAAGQVAVRMRDQVKPAMAAVRAQADLLETLVDDDLWPLPKYGELLSLD